MARPIHLFVSSSPDLAPEREALDAGRTPLAYRKSVLNSPSAQTLLRRSDVVWTTFESAQELRSHASRALAQAILDRGEQFGLHLQDVEALLALVKGEEETPADLTRRQGAERGGVILGGGG